MLDWDIERFPLKTESAFDPKKPYDPDWASKDPKPVLRSGDEGDIFEDNPQPHDHYGDAMGWTPEGQGSVGYSHPDEDNDDEDDRPADEYHVVTRPVGSNNRDEWTEHPYSAFGNAYEYTPDSAHEMFLEDNPQFDTERNPGATHEVVNVHPAEHHDDWHNQLRDEDQMFGDISRHGFERENPEIPGHMAYRHVDPYGGTHRLWYSTTRHHEGPNVHGPGWRTSYWQDGLPSDQQMPWGFHGDNVWGGNSLGEALYRADRNKAHADVLHSNTGLKPVENLHGRHYTSRRPDGSTQQLLYNQGRGDDSNWMLVHYHPESTDHSVTYHGDDLSGALDQARSNLARG